MAPENSGKEQSPIDLVESVGNDLISIFDSRLLEIVSYKIQSIVYEEIRLDMLNTSPPRWFRVEEIPKDELELNDDELLIPVAHFSKEIYSGFGIPFLLKAKEGELFSQVKGWRFSFYFSITAGS